MSTQSGVWGGVTFKCGALALPYPTSCERQVKSLNLSVPQFSALSRELGGGTGPQVLGLFGSNQSKRGAACSEVLGTHTLGSLQGGMERTRERKGCTDERICLRRYKV